VTKDIVFWAQALDNTAPDHIEWSGEFLPPEAAVRRQGAVSLVSSVKKNGIEIFSEGGVQLTEALPRFVVEVPSDQQDSAGRMAPIVCYGEYDSSLDETFSTATVKQIDEFAHRIRRTITPERLASTKRALDALKKKYRRRKLLQITAVTAVVLVILVAAFVVAMLRTP
jgi:hypothetical protein